MGAGVESLRYEDAPLLGFSRLLLESCEARQPLRHAVLNPSVYDHRLCQHDERCVDHCFA